MNLLLVILFLIGQRAYPIPVECKHTAHSPTIAGAQVTQAFGYHGHVGVDYGESSYRVGTEVFAVMDAIVIQSVADSYTYGRYVLLLHCDGYASLYGHLSRTTVEFGEVVRAGQLIGYSGGDPYDAIDGDGASTGSHLHFEIRVPGHLESNKYNIDPIGYLEEAGIGHQTQRHHPIV